MKILPSIAVLVLGISHGLAETPEIHGFRLQTLPDRVVVMGASLEFAIKTKGYVSGVAAQSFVDKKTGFRDPGYGLAIIDWLLEPGSDVAYRHQLTGDIAALKYETGDVYHGKREKRSLEGPQICTGAKIMDPKFVHGKDFIGVTQHFTFCMAAPGKNTGSTWQQTLVFPSGKRWFLAADHFVVKNESEAMFYRMDMPGHVIHQNGDSFSEVYLSTHGVISAAEFTKGNFAPDERFLYRRDAGKVPARMIRAYHLRDPKTGGAGPWLAGMTLDPTVVSEAWCHQRDYICFIQENGERPVRVGDTIQAAFIVGYFESIAEMEQTYDAYRGAKAVTMSESGWEVVR
jgi:hypothetical protein